MKSLFRKRATCDLLVRLSSQTDASQNRKLEKQTKLIDACATHVRASIKPGSDAAPRHEKTPKLFPAKSVCGPTNLDVFVANKLSNLQSIERQRQQDPAEADTNWIRQADNIGTRGRIH